MIAYILRTGRTISPFNDHVTQVMAGDELLGDAQERACREAGITPQRVRSLAEVPPGPAVFFRDDTFLTPTVLKAFRKLCEKSRIPLALALKKDAATEFCRPLQDVREATIEGRAQIVYDVYFLTGGLDLRPYAHDPGGAIALLRERAKPVEVPKKVIVNEVRLPLVGEEATTMEYPLTSSVVAPVSHWVHVLWLNQLAWGMKFGQYLYKHMAVSIIRGLVGSLAVGLGWLWDRFIEGRKCKPHAARFMARFNVIGRNPQIHPTAHLEATFIGDNVRIGAGVTVKNSILGDGVVLADHAVVLNCVVGAGTYVNENTYLVSDAIYPGCTIGQVKMQVSLIGRNTYLHGWAAFIDAKLAGGILVQQDGKMADTGRSFMGSVVGHNCIMNAKCLVHPGREIPSGTVLVNRPDEAISEVPPDLPKGVPLIREHGTLRVYHEVLQRRARREGTG